MEDARITHSNLASMSARFESAVCPEDIFGGLIGNECERRIGLRARFRSLVRACHPDLAAPPDRELATRIFQRLAEWEAVAGKKIQAGSYGDRQPYHETAPYKPAEMTVRGNTLRLTALIAEGAFSTVHAAEFAEDTADSVFVKCARDAGANDLLEREYRALTIVRKLDSDPRNERDFFSKQRAYVPRPIASFSLLDEKKAKHHASILAVPRARSYTAATLLRADKFPSGIEPKHVWWIFRRLLLTAWMAHLRGWVHGAITPDHVLVYPEAHGLVLLDWTCAAEIGEEHIPAINPVYEAFYAPETLRKEMARPSADIFMAAATAVFMLGGDPATRRIPHAISTPIAEALLLCLHPDARRRPQDAERFHAEFGALLGNRLYAEMIVP